MELRKQRAATGARGTRVPGAPGARGLPGARSARGVRQVLALLLAAVLGLSVASCAELSELGSSGDGVGDGAGPHGSDAPFSLPDMPELPDLPELPGGLGGGEEEPEAAPLPADQQPLPEPGIPGVGQGGEGEQAGGAAEMRALLATLQVKGRAPKDNYARAEFGQRWKDVDRNGCDQRNDVLARDMTEIDAPGGCKVLSGVLKDPFTGQRIDFVRGQGTSEAVQIDHVVALADAWQKGAQEWTPEKREQFGNDTMNLLAVDGPQNQKKGAGDAATWLPPNKAFRCEYVSIQIRVKAEYGLWVTPAERDAMDRELGRC